MTSYRRRVLLNALKAFDLLLVVTMFLLATYIALPHRSALSLEEFLSMRVRIGNFVLLASWLLIWHLVYASCGLYNSRRMLDSLADVRDLTKGCVAATAIIGMAGFLFHVRMFSPRFLVVFWIVVSIASIASRLFLRFALHIVRRHGRNLRNLVIVGTGPRASQFASMIESRPELGYRILGFVDQPWTGLEEFRGSGYSICDFDGLEELLRSNVVDEVVIALPIRSLLEQAQRVTAACQLQGIKVRVFSDLFDLRLANARVDDILGGMVIGHYAGMEEGWRTDAKRIFDVAVASVLLLLLLPLLLVIA